MERTQAKLFLEDLPVMHYSQKQDVGAGVYDLTKLFAEVSAIGKIISLGRLPECEIQVGRIKGSRRAGCNEYLENALNTVSRLHAFLKINSQGIVIEDNGSTGGTRVYTQVLEGNPMFLTTKDPTRSHSSVLTPGDFIYLGEYGPLRFVRR